MPRPRPPKSKPFPGHKCKGAQHWFSTSCECGWSSGMFSSRSDAYSEWRSHVEQHDGTAERRKADTAALLARLAAERESCS